MPTDPGRIAVIVQAGDFNPDLHPRDAHGHFAHKPGGGGKAKPARPRRAAGGRLVTPAQGKTVDDAIAKAEAELEATKQQLQADQHAEMAKMLAEIKKAHDQLIAADKAETKADLRSEEKHRTKVKLIHHIMALGVAAILSWLALRMDVSPLLGLLGGYGPLFLQEGADALRRV